jgi:ribosome-associated protein
MDDLPVGDWNIPAEELDERFDTSGGPGGQHANRNETSVRLRLDVNKSSLPEEIKSKLISRIGSVIEVSASDQRSQSRNRETARTRLKTKIESVLVDPKPRRKTKPTKASKNRRVDAKKARSEVKKQRRRPGIDD